MSEAQRPIGLATGAAVEAAGQDARKYSTSNPVVRWLIGRLISQIAGASHPDARRHVDVGVGEGLALERLGLRATTLIGVEYRVDKLRDARTRLPDLRGIVGDAGMLPLPPGAADQVSCIEVLEHLEPVEPAIRELARITSPTGACVISVPWEPWFRLGNLARGKNLRRWGNDPEHVQQFNRTTLQRALAGHFETVAIRPSFPWLVAVARDPRTPAPVGDDASMRS